MAGTVRRGAIVSGKVQGVGFRWAARERALSLSLSGFVRNRADGSVEVEAEGAVAAVDEFVAWLRAGPPSAEVSGVAVADRQPTGEPSFDVR